MMTVGMLLPLFEYIPLIWGIILRANSPNLLTFPLFYAMI